MAGHGFTQSPDGARRSQFFCLLVFRFYHRIDRLSKLQLDRPILSTTGKKKKKKTTSGRKTRQLLIAKVLYQVDTQLGMSECKHGRRFMEQSCGTLEATQGSYQMGNFFKSLQTHKDSDASTRSDGPSQTAKAYWHHCNLSVHQYASQKTPICFLLASICFFSKETKIFHQF